MPPKAILDNQGDRIIQTQDGEVEVYFAPNQVSRLSLTRNLSSMESLRNLLYPIAYPPSRHSVSGERPLPIDEYVIQGVRLSDQQVPHGVYGDPLIITNRNITMKLRRLPSL